MLTVEKEKELRGLTFQYWLENNCCDLRDVAREFGLTYPIISKWRRQDNWDKKAKEMIRDTAIDRQKSEKGSDAEMYNYHIKLVRFLIAKFSKIMNDTDSQDPEYVTIMNQCKNNLLGLINMEQALKKGEKKITLKEIEEMYYIPPNSVTKDLKEEDEEK